MKLEQFTVSNFRNAKAVTITCGSCHAIVGGNNAGKSTLLRALDLFFNPSKRRINEESFWNKDTTKDIRVEGVFGALSADEREKLKPYLRADGRFQLARTVKWKGEEAAASDGDEDDEAKCEILTTFCRPEPKYPWLRESEINGEAVKQWWNNKESLVANGQAFAALAGSSRPGVGDWKTKAGEFAAKFLKPEDYEDRWSPNPQGFSNVLKGTLPMFVFVPAVRDVQDEAKGTSASPFGKMLRAIVESVPKEKKKELEDSLTQIKQALNRGGGSRLPAVTDAENQLNENLRKIFTNCDLEIEFQTPDFTYLLASPKLLVNDGYRGGIENKGHGLQRAAIFAILQSFATQTAATGAQTRRTLIFAVEEPELYMHPQAQRTIRRLFKDVAKTDQVFFSTHSSFMVDVAYFDEIIRVESRPVKVTETSNSVESFVFQVEMADMILDLETRYPATKGNTTADSFRDLYAHAYNPTRNEGFFASRVILAEGNTEEYALPIYAEACGHRFDKDSVSVVSSGGKESLDRLYRVFNELGIPCFVVMDYDQGSADAVSSSKQLLEWLNHPTDVPNKILLTDSVACFQKDWEAMCAAEVADYATLKEAARKALGVKADAGKPLIARYIARVLTSRNPAVVPPSIAAVLTKATGCKHTGSCLRKPA